MKRDHYTQIIEEIDQMVADAGIDPAAAIDHPLDEVEAFLMRFVAYPCEAARVAHVLWIGHAHGAEIGSVRGIEALEAAVRGFESARDDVRALVQRIGGRV